MQDYKLAFVPKQKIASCRQVCRRVGPTTDKIHMHNSAELTLIPVKGASKWISNGNAFLIKTPAVIWNRAGSFHELWEVYEQDCRSYVSFYKPQLFSEIPSRLCYEQLFEGCDMLALPLTESQLEPLLPLFVMLQTAPLTQKRYLFLCIFDQMTRLIAEGTEPIRSGITDSYIFEVTALLQNPDGEKLTLEALSARFHVSTSKLKTDFKKVTGMPIHTFRRHVQLQSARILLETTNQELAQIAYTCGFTDESYFIRSFRKEFGITPGTYRKQLKNK